MVADMNCLSSCAMCVCVCVCVCVYVCVCVCILLYTHKITHTKHTNNVYTF
jgi:hypothetical protein